MELALGWIRSDTSIRAALVRASMACDEERQAVLETKAARDAALGEVVEVRDRCKALEDELQGLRDQLAKEVRLRQEQEEGMKARKVAIEGREAKLKKRRDRLGALGKELEAMKVELDSKAQVLAEDCVAFADMEKKAREAAIEGREAKLKKRRDRLSALGEELEVTRVELDSKAKEIGRASCRERV